MMVVGAAEPDALCEDELGESMERGLTNLGNTCYMNAVLQARSLSAALLLLTLVHRSQGISWQALSHCPPLTHYLRCCTALYLPGLAAASDSTVRQVGQPYLRCKLTEAFAATLRELLVSGGGQPTVRPQELLDAVHELMPTFRRHEQQDSQALGWAVVWP